MSEVKVTRLKLHNIMLNYSDLEEKKSRVHDFLNEIFNTDNDEKVSQKLIKYTQNNFFSPYIRFWKKCSRCNKIFLTKYQHRRNSLLLLQYYAFQILLLLQVENVRKAVR